MDKMQALHSFWSSFGIPAYDMYTVPDEAKMPYITYEAADDSFGNKMDLMANLWYKSNSWAGINSKANVISDRISRGGINIPFDGGAIWIRKSTPWAQRIDEPEDSTVRRLILSITVEFLD